MNSDVVLAVAGLDAWYGGAQILRDISLEVRRGEVVALMGRNGAGKSTTLKSIMGMVERRAKSITFQGRSIGKRSPYKIARLGIGFTPEDRRIFSELTVLENLDVGRQRARQFPDGTPAPSWDPEKLFALFPNLGEMPERPGDQMSGGEQQMLAVARTLMGNPLLVLLDEPSEGLAPVIVEQMANTIAELKQQGLSILLSEQNIPFASLVCDRAYVLEMGQIRWEGAMSELVRNTEVQRTFLTM
ncbi:MAG TPA: ABC transporter ATP-binding protein [Xanthobacteraceae bacterium]|jgi:branched-chain amino acid transport system ATP-binding protein|nr:ABC transporter ATP-binding protein [Xanthobacteraceae bacterium]